MHVQTIPLAVVIACDALFALLAIPLMLRKVPPNALYGYRTRATLRDAALWYDANAHFGRGFFVASLVSGAAALALGAVRIPDAATPLAVAVLVIPPLLAALSTARHVRRLRA